jgi:hypothetical protein
MGIEPMTSSLPRKCSTTELRGPVQPTPGRSQPRLLNTPTGNRTPVYALRTRRPRPLDDGSNAFHCQRNARRAVRPSLQALSVSALQHLKHARQESNLQPPVLETGALPIELRT